MLPICVLRAYLVLLQSRPVGDVAFSLWPLGCQLALGLKVRGGRCIVCRVWELLGLRVLTVALSAHSRAYSLLFGSGVNAEYMSCVVNPACFAAGLSAGAPAMAAVHVHERVRSMHRA